MNRHAFSGYIKTFCLAVLISFMTVIFLMAIAQFRAYHLVKTQDTPEKDVNPYVVNVLIEKDKYLAMQNPKDYLLNIKLGLLYEYINDFDDAEIQYKLSIAKRNFDDYTPYKNLALLYIRENKLEEASTLMDNIDERPYNPLISLKAYIYAIIGNTYYGQGDYESAISFYQKSLIYYKILNVPEEKTVVDSMASAYVYSAEQYITNLDSEDAIETLKEADKLENAPIIKYKLALLLMASNSAEAYNYFQQVFKREPSIINYDIYYNFILTLAAEADSKGNYALGDLYRFRARKFREYYTSHVITVDDINLQYIDGKITYNVFSRKYKLKLQMKLRNTTDRPIRSLYTIIQFKNEDGTPISNYVTQVVDDKSILAPSSLSPIIDIHTHKRKSLSDEHPKKAVAEVYFAISPNSYKVHLATFHLSEKMNKRQVKR
ncbi:hypothetical protein KBA27_05385 [bacterium]|nr:hypothetical protein [bacterium]